MLGHIVAPIMVGAPARGKSLTVGGLDMVLKPGPPGNNYGVPIGSVIVHEAGPGGVSDMSFAINDPLFEVGLSEGMAVAYWDHVRDAPIFAGFVQSWSYSPEAIGRNIAVTCVGIDAVLDWSKVTSLTIPALTTVAAAVQACANAALGVGVALVAVINTGSLTGTIGRPMGDHADLTTYDVVIANATLRDAIGQCLDASQGPRLAYWVDMYGGLRTVYDIASVPIPLDYRDIAVVDRAGGSAAASDLQYLFDASAVPHQVQVVGATPAASALVSDGTRLPGPIAQLQDGSITTGALAYAAGYGYLVEHGSSIRGQFDLSAKTPSLGPGVGINQRAGTSVTITDDQVGLAGATFRVSAIAKRFNPSGTEEWTVAFGGAPPSLSRLTRHLTRDQLS